MAGRRFRCGSGAIFSGCRPAGGTESFAGEAKFVSPTGPAHVFGRPHGLGPRRAHRWRGGDNERNRCPRRTHIALRLIPNFQRAMALGRAQDSSCRLAQDRPCGRLRINVSRSARRVQPLFLATANFDHEEHEGHQGGRRRAEGAYTSRARCRLFRDALEIGWSEKGRCGAGRPAHKTGGGPALQSECVPTSPASSATVIPA
jgi:hypothetical protein